VSFTRHPVDLLLPTTAAALSVSYCRRARLCVSLRHFILLSCFMLKLVYLLAPLPQMDTKEKVRIVFLFPRVFTASSLSESRCESKFSP
jgi:hypothetical protein